jgi:hypothetical protein
MNKVIALFNEFLKIKSPYTDFAYNQVKGFYICYFDFGEVTDININDDFCTEEEFCDYLQKCIDKGEVIYK